MRRFIALIVLVLAVYGGLHFRSFDMLGPVVALMAVLVGILAGAVLLFDLPLSRPGPSQDSGFGLPEPASSAIGFFGLLLFAFAPLFIALRGLYQGQMPALGSGPDVSLAQSPGVFLTRFVLWLAIGLFVLWLARKTMRRAKADSSSSDAPDR